MGKIFQLSQVDIALGDKNDQPKGYVFRVSEKWYSQQFKMNPDELEDVMWEAIELLQASAGARASTWPISRAFTGAKRRRRRLPQGHVHSKDLFYQDVRDTPLGPYIVVKNRAPYARGIEAGWYDARHGTRRKPKWVMRRFFRSLMRGKFGDTRVRATWLKSVRMAWEKNERETRRALWQANRRRNATHGTWEPLF